MRMPGRNQPCPCGSGKKYKNCCLSKPVEATPGFPALSFPGQPSQPDYLFPDRQPQSRGWPVTREDSWVDMGATDEWEALARWENEFEPDDSDDAQTIASPYPQPDLSLPELAENERQLVNAWNDQYDLLITGVGGKDLARHIQDFIEQHPHLCPYLDLEDVLYEWGAALGPAQGAQYAFWLRRLRELHSQVYLHCYTEADLYLIQEQIATGQQVQIPTFFSYFFQYPDHAEEYLISVADLLAWAGCQPELLLFSERLVEPMMKSPHIEDTGCMMPWRLLAAAMPFLEKEEDCRAAAKGTVQAFWNQNPPLPLDMLENPIQDMLSGRWEKPDVFLNPGNPRRGKAYDRALHWNFAAFLHDELSFCWACASFIGDELFNFMRMPHKTKKAWARFHVNAKSLDRYLTHVVSPGELFPGVHLAGLLEGLWHFADYLKKYGGLPADQAASQQQLCWRLFHQYVENISPLDPVVRLMPEFPRRLRAP